VRYGINLVTILFNNEAYGNVLRDQLRLFEGRESGSALSNPDFQVYAKAFGVRSWRVTDATVCARADRSADGKRSDAHRGDDRHHQGSLAVGGHFPGRGSGFRARSPGRAGRPAGVDDRACDRYPPTDHCHATNAVVPSRITRSATAWSLPSSADRIALFASVAVVTFSYRRHDDIAGTQPRGLGR